MAHSLTVYLLEPATEHPVKEFGLDINLWVSRGSGKWPAILRPVTTADGGFSFSDLPSGEHPLHVRDLLERYPPLHHRVTVADMPGDQLLRLHLTPGAFISGQILDEHGRTPQFGHFTILTLGESCGRPCYMGRSHGHVAGDGQFRSPALYPGRHLLHIHGQLRQPATKAPPDTAAKNSQRNGFSFLYPNSRAIEGATAFDLAVGEHLDDVHISIQPPAWRLVQGQVVGDLPEDILADHSDGGPRLEFHAYWDPGTGSPVPEGIFGIRLHTDRSFKMLLQPGRYVAEIIEFGDSWGQMVGRATLHTYGFTAFNVPEHDVDGVEVFAGPPKHPYVNDEPYPYAPLRTPGATYSRR